jgi:hypothetical protein
MERRQDLDFIRVSIFFLLIVYHTSLIFGSREFLIKSSESTIFFDSVHVLSHPWRVSLLFFVSGAATAFALRRWKPGELRSRRSRQLLIPFLIGIILLIPPQIHAFLSVHEGMPISMVKVFWRYLSFSPFELADGSRTVIFTMEHLWYLAYLWLYTAIYTTLVRVCGSHLDIFGGWLAARLKGAGLLLWPMAFFVLLRIIVMPQFPHRLDIINDWYSHMRYLSCFAGGVLLGGRTEFWQNLLRVRKPALVGALACGPILLWMLALHPLADDRFWSSPQVSLIDGSFMWCTVVAILGYGQMLATFHHPALSYLNKAVLTYYVLHQTVMLLIAEQLHAMGWLGIGAFLPLVVLTLLTCGLFYEVWRRLWLMARRLRPVPSLAAETARLAKAKLIFPVPGKAD